MNKKLSLEQWKAAVVREYGSNVQFTVEDGFGKTYGDVGNWTAHTGPDMQADVVGCYVPGDFCWLYRGNIDYEYDAE